MRIVDIIVWFQNHLDDFFYWLPFFIGFYFMWSNGRQWRRVFKLRDEMKDFTKVMDNLAELNALARSIAACATTIHIKGKKENSYDLVMMLQDYNSMSKEMVNDIDEDNVVILPFVRE